MSDGQRSEGLTAYLLVTVAYWSFMLTDGALRMLVLLHFHTLGFSPVQLAYLFILYEVAGMITNIAAGWLAARFGLTSTLFAGLLLQVIALLALSQLDASWTTVQSVVFVMTVQGLSGVAKDLAKMSSKSAVKQLAPEKDNGLFRWVAVLTGSKNAVKGLGFLVGAALLGLLGFTASVLVLAAALSLVFVLLWWAMPTGLSSPRKSAKFTEVFSHSSNINRLSLARVFLFGARDVWFVVGIPIYFYSVLSDGSVEGNRNAFFMIGTFMALWIMVYGAVQASAPKLLNAKDKSQHHWVLAARQWAWMLAVVPAVLTLAAGVVAFQSAGAISAPPTWFTVVLVTGLWVFGGLFAINSALHSYLILAFSQSERVTMAVGFYYMANAGGRLLGTLLSGLSYQLGGLPLMLAVATGMVVLAAFVTRRLLTG